MNPYFIMAILYFVVASLGALDVSLVNFDIIPIFAGFRWLRVHFITLGILSEVLFGALPLIVAARSGLKKPRVRWDIWLLLNSGIIILLLGIPPINQILINLGGTLVFVAGILLIWHLVNLAPKSTRSPEEKEFSGRWFYIMGTLYLLLGVLIGTGLWQPWLQWFEIKVPLEVHIHANNWGFMSLVFAGLIVDFFPRISNTSLAYPKSIKTIFWMMTLGALGLVLGPWVQSNYFSVPGIILHLSATIWLLANVIKPVKDKREKWSVGLLHLVTSYVWILAPVLVAPLIILEVPGFPGAGIEQNAPQALIYGWVLQFSYAMLPLIARSIFSRDKILSLGGNWFSLITAHLGGILLWSGIFLVDTRSNLHGIAYALWFVSMLPILFELWQIIQQDSEIAEDTNAKTVVVS